MTRPKGVFAGFVLLCCSVTLAVVTYQFVHFWMSPSISTGPLKTVFYEVKPNESAALIGADFEKLGIVSSGRLFYWYGRLSGKSKKFKAGDYRFTNKMRPDDVMAIITSGVSYGFPLTVPEGYNMAQIAELIENVRPGSGDRFLKLCSNRKFIGSIWDSLRLHPPLPENLEGYLFPDTYLIGRKTPEEEVVRQMVRKFRGIFTTELASRAKAMGFTERQAVTLASIIEKETGARQERPLISSVFHNRLKKKMRLQSDPTVIYGIKDYNGNITRRDLEAFTPYNTYRIKALPPGPIGNPGKESILAALYPAESDSLYFVSHNDGTHEFTSTYEDHLKAVVRFQIDKHAREGKSWDLNKQQQRTGSK